MFEFKTVMNNIKNLEWKKYFYKNLLICSLVIFFVFSIITITLTGGYRRAVNNEMNRYCMGVVFNIKDKINKVFDILSESYSEFLGTYNDDVRIMAYSGDITTGSGVKSVKSIKNVIDRYSSNPGYVDSIYFYFPKSGYIISNSTQFSGNFRSKFHDAMWIDDYEKNGKSVNVRTVKRRGMNKSYLTFIKSLNIGGDNLIAYNIDIESFLNSVNEKLREFYIIDNCNNIIYAQDTDLIGKTLEDAGETGEKIGLAVKDESDMVESRDNIILMSTSAGIDDYKIVVGIDSTEHDNQMKKIKLMMVFIMLLSVLITVVLAFFIVSEFYNNILDLVLVIEGKERKNERSFHEVKFIKNKILTMLDKNSKIENELANRIELVSKTKIEAMQSQLNSHFLYNTLNLISAIDILEHKRDTNTIKAITELSAILRYAMNRDSYTAPLREELIFINKYLEIQRMRYRDKFEYIEEIDDSLMNVSIIKMIIQPLVENAIFHGIVPSGRKCTLTLKIDADGDMLKIRVIDDGVGISDEKVKELRAKFAEGIVSSTQTHGLLSVNQRCMLFYGEEYGCEVESRDGKTIITVKHPVLNDKTA